MTDLVIHGHFYQPPRENAWTGMIDREPSARPDHDWNERIHRECYRANAFARVFDGFGRVLRVVNNYAHASFNFGPTLLTWIERHDPATYARILEADRESARARVGHGNAIAQGYNHAILPLCNGRDRLTQVRWGIADFRRRFGREPEALWLPETACNDATLATLIDAGMRFVILSPHQAERVRPAGQADWSDVSGGTIDPGVAYRWLHPDGSGRQIACFFYDGPIARSIAFQGALSSSQAFVARLRQAAGGDGRLLGVATDGESYGHHTRHGDRVLAHALLHEAPSAGFSLTNYGEHLERHPPTAEVALKPGPDGEGTAWSCAHGVGRWLRDCGCSTGAREGWNQAWRAPLRRALDLLRDEAARSFEATRGDGFVDPWTARDAYVELILEPRRSRVEWLRQHTPRELGAREQERALVLLEIQRYAQLMYTSCGWFFADVSGLETVQVLKYAGRVLDLMLDLDLRPPREAFLGALSEARSNLPEMGSGADVFRRFVDPLRTTPARVAAHLAITALVDGAGAEDVVAGYDVRRSGTQRQRHGRLVLSTGRLELEERATGRRHDFATAALYVGGVDFHCSVRAFPGGQRFDESAARLWAKLPTGSLPTLLRTAEQEFGPEEHGLTSVLPDGLERISRLVFGDVVKRFADEYVHLYETNARILEMLAESGFELPAELRAAAEFAFARRFDDAIRRVAGSRDPQAYSEAVEVAEGARKRGYAFDRSAAGGTFGELVTEATAAAVAEPSAERFRAAAALVDVGRRLGFAEWLARAQELVFDAIGRGLAIDDDVRGLAGALGLAVTERPG